MTSGARTVYYVPIIHTAADLGSQAEALRDRYRARFGDEALRRHDAAIGRMWEAIRGTLLGLDVDWRRVKVYQDGLPVCGREREIVDEVAALGSVNHQILLELVGKGATLLGSEDPKLLVRELERVRGLARLDAEPSPAPATLEEARAEGARLLEARDAFIARRIDETLGPGETGVVFLGLLHRVNERLPRDIEVRPLMPELPLGADAP